MGCERLPGRDRPSRLMDQTDDYQKLLNAAFRFVSFRPRSEKEIRDFLEKKLKKYNLYAPTIVGKAMDRLTELDYIDDAKFASWLVEQRNLYRPKGNRLLIQELKAKGIQSRYIVTDELGNARRAIQKKIPIWKKLSPLAQKKKIYDFLGRRGFAGSTIFRIVDEVVGKGYNKLEDLNEDNEQ